MTHRPGLGYAVAFAVLAAGCGSPMGVPLSAEQVPFRLAAWSVSTAATASPSPASPSPIGSLKPVASPTAASTPSAPATPSASPIQSSSGGGGADVGGVPVGDTSGADSFAVSLTPDPTSVLVDPNGVGFVGNDAHSPGSVTVTVPGFITSTVVLGTVPAAQVSGFHLEPILGSPVPTGIAVLTGTMGAAGAGLEVAYHSPSQSALAHVTADATGAFVLSVPVSGTEQGVVVAFLPTEAPPVAIAKVQISAGQSVTVLGLVPQAPIGSIVAPSPPAGMALAGAHLALLDDFTDPTVRLDLVSFTVGIVPHYTAPSGLKLAGAFDALQPNGNSGSTLLLASGEALPFLSAPDLSSIPATIVAGAVLSWPPVSGATLYTLSLQAAGNSIPIWQGASATPRLVVAPSLPAVDNLSLQVRAWAANDVSIYTVADAEAKPRALRVPVAPASTPSRVSWSIRSGLQTQSD